MKSHPQRNSAVGSARALALVAFSLLIAACAPLAPPPPAAEPRPLPSPRAPEPPKPAPKPPRPADGIPSSDVSRPGAAVQSLLDQGWSHYNRRDFQGALAYAERAQRIDTRAPDVYLLMASAQFSLYRLAVAEQLARKGLAISAAGTPVYRQLQDLLVRIGAAGR